MNEEIDAGVRYSEDTFISGDGYRIFFRESIITSPRASVAIVHGYCEHSARYRDFTAHLNGNGFDVHAFDLRGHGRSEGPRAAIGSFGEYHDDLSRFMELVRGRGGGRPVFLLGHSLGGLIVLSWALDHARSVRGVAVTSPYLRLRLPVPAVKLAAARIASRLLPSLSLASEVSARALSHDPRIVTEYENDPLVLRINNARWFTESLAAQAELMAEAGRFEAPLLVLHGGDDMIADPAASRRFFEAAGSRDKQHRQFDYLYHEILNEPERAAIYGHIVGWLTERA